MTGFAVEAVEQPVSGGVPRPRASVELRSVNGRFLDLSLRVPDEWRALEPALRELVQAGVKRGKVELRASTAREAEPEVATPTPEQLARLAHLESHVQGWLPKARPMSVAEALHWCRGTRGEDTVPAEAVLAAVRRCVQGLREARAREGERLVAMLRERLGALRDLAARAAPLVPQVVQRQRERFLQRFREAAEAAQAAGAPAPTEAAMAERSLAEAAAFALRIDVAEELTRLASHLDEIERLLAAGGEAGKRLDFQIQELQREANTLGSKAAAFELTQIAVEMKVAIEQMREQVQNIE
jgi:uncharacterized protein (TIGR00255 family)